MSMATDVVDAQIEAYRAKDVERFLSCYADGASVFLFDGKISRLMLLFGQLQQGSRRQDQPGTRTAS